MISRLDQSTPQLAISLLGGFQARRLEKPIPFATDRARALLAYLAVESGQPHRRETLATLLWPEDKTTSARQNLRQTLARVRHAVGHDEVAHPVLEITRTTLQLNYAALLTVDLLDFQALLATSNEANRDAPEQAGGVLYATEVERITAAIELYRGPFLDGTHLADSEPFEEWVLLTRQQAQRQVLDALNRLTTHYAATNDHDLAQQYAAGQLDIEPWRESAHRQLMTALARSGQRAAALAQFESCRTLLGDELAVEPDDQTVRLAEQIRAGEVVGRSEGVTEPALSVPKEWQDEKMTSVPPSPSHLDPYAILNRLDPLPDQKLFGVEKALARVQDAVNAEERSWLVSIDGIGGIGKTTLANALVHKLLNHESRITNHESRTTPYQDIGWVSAKQDEYSPDRGIRETGKPALDAETLMDLLLAQLSDGPYPTGSSHEKRMALTKLLKEKPSLVVVDNLETAVDYEALLPLLRQLANPSKFLITSRLSLAGQGDVYCHSLSELSGDDALAFLRYEAESRGMTALINADDAQLQTIYEAVGGNPLALKLVLGQIQFLPLEQVLASLRVAATERAEQLYSYIYWQAWQMLTQESRHLLLTMPVTPNATFTQLGAASGLEEESLQSAIMQLRALSLVEIGGDLSEPRYRLHRLTETFLIHEVVKWRDPNQPETSVEAQFFLQRVLAMVQRWEADEAVQEIEIERLDREYEAILKAISFGLELSQAWTVVKKLIIALTSYMERRGHWAVWHTMLERAIAAAKREDDLDGEITLTALLARLCQRESKPKDVERYYARVIRMARRSGNRFEEARACSNLGYAYIDGGHWWRSEVLSCHALKIFEELGSEHGLAHTHNHLGVLYTRQRRWDYAEHHLLQACELWDRMDDLPGTMRGYGNLSFLYLCMEKPVDVMTCSHKACNLAAQLGDQPQLGGYLMNIGMAYNLMNDVVSAKTYISKAEQIFKEFRNSLGLAQVWHNLGVIAMSENNWADSERYFLEALSYYRTHSNIDGEMKVLENIIEKKLASSDYRGAQMAISEFEAFVATHAAPTQHDYFKRQLKKQYQHLDTLLSSAGIV